MFATVISQKSIALFLLYMIFVFGSYYAKKFITGCFLNLTKLCCFNLKNNGSHNSQLVWDIVKKKGGNTVDVADDDS